MSSEVAVEMQGGRWKRYPAYRDSGVEWLGEVPEGWPVKPLKFIARIETGNTPSRADEHNYDNGVIPWVKPDDLGSLMPITDSKDKLTEFGISFARLVPKGSALVCCIGTVGKVGIAGCDLTTNQQINAVIFDHPDFQMCYGQYALIASKSEYEKIANTVVVSIINKTSQSGISYPIPLPPEQRAIAAFLDRETGRIDTLITKKERQIELLQEKRAALISHAVTKGLDPDVKMKDSGVEWLGEVPDEWSSTAVKHHFDIQLGKMLQNKPDSDELLVPYAKALHVLWGKVETNDLPEMWANTFEIQQYGIKEGDLLVCEGGEVGRAGIVKLPPKQCIIQNALHRVRAKSSSDLRYLLYVLHAVNSSTWFDVLCNKATIAHFTREKFSDLIIPIPPLSEQRTIAAFLDRETGHIDTLTIKIRESLLKLHEYRTALISAAVTGKIDVRSEET